MGLEIKKELLEDKYQVTPIGEIDIMSSEELKKEIKILIDEKKDIIINGEKIEYMDSTGLGVLISLLKKTKENDNKIVIKNLKPNIYKLFNITGLTKVFEIE
ncbi:MAG: STAS domain-containing protein [Tissierellales bacterium]|jgi:anti-sigma B factor antagonist|nr:STAS domain-containing protein [Tissierellales bacterium]